MSRRSRIGSAALLTLVVAAGTGLASFKHASLEEQRALGAEEQEPVESVRAARAALLAHRPTTTAIGTVLALRSITLRNELPGTVREVHLAPGAIVEPGDVLVALDVSVEQAELEALRARAALAETLYQRAVSLNAERALSDEELDRAIAERDVARVNAIIERKTIRAPFRARVGLADLHPGQYLNEGSVLTTLQGVDDAVHIDFDVPQQVAAALEVGERVTVTPRAGRDSVEAEIVAVDARIDPSTRNAAVRARLDGAGTLAPGASVRVEVPSGPAEQVVTVPATALRKGPAGDHVFVLAHEAGGTARARLRSVETGPLLGDQVVIRRGLAHGELVAASGSFKLQDATLVAINPDPTAEQPPALAADRLPELGGTRSISF